MYTIDTNMLIYDAAGEDSVVAFFKSIPQATHIVLPTIVIIEFLCFPKLKASHRNRFIDRISSFDVISLDSEIAFRAAEVRRKYKITLGDSVIAATALLTGSMLLTRNVRDFRKVPNLKLLKV